MSVHVIVKTADDGIYFGEFISRENNRVILNNARRMWDWQRHLSLPEIAYSGVTLPNECKFSRVIPSACMLHRHYYLCTETAQISLENVPDTIM